ncbi:hypothetical protein [Actinokineospora enzanensis]|uniref:hypothetical protein n=1 Tax=Actinokineospora enzanensis TaxID=155975 RepID=UPI0003776215|nr:hypothetical protein [Actinokineospora enzanensis]
MTTRWAFLTALAATGALLFRHPFALWATNTGWDVVWLVPAAGALGLFLVWRFPSRAWPWLLTAGAAGALTEAVLWIDNWPMARSDEELLGVLQTESLLSATSATVLLIGVLGGAARLVALDRSMQGIALTGVAVGMCTVGAPLALSFIEPSTWEVVPFVAAGVALAGAVGAILVTWRDQHVPAGRPSVLVSGVLAVLACAAVDVFTVVNPPVGAQDEHGIEIDRQAGVVALSAMAVLVVLAACTAWRAALETTALIVVATVGVMLMRVGTAPARPDVAPDASGPVVLLVTVAVFAVAALWRHRAWLFVAVTALAGVLVPLLVSPDRSTASGVAMLVVGAGLVTLAGAVVAERAGGAPGVGVVLAGLIGVAAAPLGERGILTFDPGFLMGDDDRLTWWMAVLLVGAAALVAAGMLIGGRRPEPARAEMPVSV